MIMTTPRYMVSPMSSKVRCQPLPSKYPLFLLSFWYAAKDLILLSETSKLFLLRQSSISERCTANVVRFLRRLAYWHRSDSYSIVLEDYYASCNQCVFYFLHMCESNKDNCDRGLFIGASKKYYRRLRILLQSK
jgi:hypothetical protein